MILKSMQWKAPLLCPQPSVSPSLVQPKITGSLRNLPEIFYAYPSKCISSFPPPHKWKLALPTVMHLEFFHPIIYFGAYLVLVYIDRHHFVCVCVWLCRILLYKLVYLTSSHKSFPSLTFMSNVVVNNLWANISPGCV